MDGRQFIISYHYMSGLAWLLQPGSVESQMAWTLSCFSKVSAQGQIPEKSITSLVLMQITTKTYFPETGTKLYICHLYSSAELQGSYQCFACFSIQILHHCLSKIATAFTSVSMKMFLRWLQQMVCHLPFGLSNYLNYLVVMQLKADIILGSACLQPTSYVV